MQNRGGILASVIHSRRSVLYTFSFLVASKSPTSIISSARNTSNTLLFHSPSASSSRTLTSTTMSLGDSSKGNINTFSSLSLSSLPTKWSDIVDTDQSTSEINLSFINKNLIPPMTDENHKGSSGRVGVLGGSERYTGAPYYAAMASLKVGADLSFVFCAQEASVPIKCYSPELMVAPVYNAKEFEDALSLEGENGKHEQDRLVDSMVKNVVSLFNRMHVLIIGPGLGRCPLVLRATAEIIKLAKEQNLPLVIDADGLFLLTLEPYHDLLNGYENVILTPNAMEMRRLSSVDSQKNGSDPLLHLNGNVIVQKGKHDIISTNLPSLISMECHEKGGLKRSGGIGDILAGSMGTFLAWNNILSKKQQIGEEKRKLHLVIAAWTACSVVKRATNEAFRNKRRSMTAPDILDVLGEVSDRMTSET